jgi:Na+/H+ antiporter NhaD/arsenite permease-like protein
MLASIAVLPLTANHFWEKNKNKLLIALVLGLPVAVWLVAMNQSEELIHTMVFDYVPFIILLGSLFVITGGIYVEGDIEARPMINTAFLGIGSVLASFMGTTGAAMLLIRPLIKTNKERYHKSHTILFFIAIVANCGGLLTPLGDPPLFMMYLRGAPFFWFFSLIKEWFVTNILLLIIYYFVDVYYYKKESPEAIAIDESLKEPIRIKGKRNFILLFTVVLAIALLNENTLSFIKSGHISSYIREAIIFFMAILSLLFTKKSIRLSNEFSWYAIIEVAYLFLGIFITMVPCLLYLEFNADRLGVTTPKMFYYITGALSSFLDNTPTAVTFYSLAVGLVEKTPELVSGANIVARIPEIFLAAISTGAVFFGSMTYIGNGPNFMVKSIAESQKIKMPHFFGYMYKFSLIVLLPLFILVQLLFI